MVTQVNSATDINYPDSDGQPMADNTIQFRWISVIKYNLDWLFVDRSNVFVAGDLLWYPVEGNNKLRQAPDVMVIFGVRKGDRGSYKQWQENDIAPQVVFEILSPGNTTKEMNRKLLFYDRYGVEEYYVYDPQKNILQGWLRAESWLDVIEDIQNWTSPRLQIKFELGDETLLIYRPDGNLFEDYDTVQRARIEAQEQLSQTKQQLTQTEQQLEVERQKNKRLEELLREAGIDLED